MLSTRGRLLVLGGNPLHGSDTPDSRMGDCLWDLSLGQRTGDGRFDGETFLGGLLIFFLGGRGRGRGTPGHDIAQWRFHWRICQTIANGGPVPRCPGQTRALFQTSITRRPSPHTEDSEGTVTPRSATDSTEQWV
jgi:hypothetical protein